MSKEDSFEENIGELLDKYAQLESNSSLYFTEDEIQSLLMHFDFLRDMEKQLNLLEHAIYLHPFSVNFHLDLSKLYSYLDDKMKGEVFLKKAKSLNPINSETLSIEAEYAIENFNYDEAEVLFLEALKYSKEEDLEYQIELNISIAEFYFDISKEEKAFQVMKRAINRLGIDNYLGNFLFYLYENSEQLENGVDFFKLRIDESPYSFLDWYYLGKLYLSLEEYDLAKSAFEFCQAIGHNSYTVDFEIGQILEAKNEYQSAIKSYLTNDTYVNNEKFCIPIARCYFALDDLENAKYYLEQCNLNHFNDDEWYTLYGSIYLKKEDFKRAYHYFKSVLIKSNNDDSAVIGSFICLFEMNKMKELASFYEETIENRIFFMQDYWKELLSVINAFDMEILEENYVNHLLEGKIANTIELNYILAVINFEKNPTPHKKSIIIKNLIEDFEENYENISLICPELLLNDKEIIKIIEHYKNTNHE